MKNATRLALPLLVATAGILAAPPALRAQDALDRTGEKFAARYEARLGSLEAKIRRGLPRISDAKRQAYLEARQAEFDADAAIEVAKKRLGEIGTAEALVGHAKGKWIGGADKGIAAARKKIAEAKDAATREAAEKELAHWEQNRRDGEQALAERQANLDALVGDRPALEKAVAEAEAKRDAARVETLEALDRLGVGALLASDRLDAELAEFVALKEATPRRLAAYAQQGREFQSRVEGMLEDEALLLQMAVADGAKEGRYDRAIEIYDAIQQVSSGAKEGTLQRLALAVALEHSTPIGQRNAEATTTDAPAVVDPIARYRHYEAAFLAGELDAAFAGLTVWDYRLVVYGEEPDEILSWGRETLRNYRPDQITNPDYRWRYVDSVRTDIRYGSQDNQHDEQDLQFFQNILKNGGVCGRRAFYGRFMLRAFGIPTTARPQRGHAALVHWTPDGWVPCLGAGWGSGWTQTRYGKDLDFLANTQARATGDHFLRVKRAQWIGDVMGEKPVYGLLGGKPEFWYAVSLDAQRALIDAAKSKALDAVGQDIAEANETKETVDIAKVVITDEDRAIDVAVDGTITIPAAATSSPTRSTGKILFLNSVLGGKQLHYSRNGGAQEFEYVFDAPKAGTYQLTARIVTPSWQQILVVKPNGTTSPVEIELPNTVGAWSRTEPVDVELVVGRNVLRFGHRSTGQAKGFSVRDFTLTPR
ncbi:MAG: hypothetical protein O3C51_09940 [Planctomycetota bacterium]|nr:hypothetical protein [Planctomycetota bacterium]